jgi:hypothetical protein
MSREAGNNCTSMWSSSTIVSAPFILMSGVCSSVLSAEAAPDSVSLNVVTAVRNKLSGLSKAVGKFLTNFLFISQIR